MADIENYPDFLPWCVGARVRERKENYVIADLIAKFKGFTEVFTSKVTFHSPSPADPKAKYAIFVDLTDGPFTHLSNSWQFEPSKDGGTDIHFTIDFAFKSKMLEKLIGLMFEKAMHKMVGAFEARADEIYTKE